MYRWRGYVSGGFPQQGVRVRVFGRKCSVDADLRVCRHDCDIRPSVRSSELLEKLGFGDHVRRDHVVDRPQIRIRASRHNPVAQLSEMQRCDTVPRVVFVSVDLAVGRLVEKPVQQRYMCFGLGAYNRTP